MAEGVHINIHFVHKHCVEYNAVIVSDQKWLEVVYLNCKVVQCSTHLGVGSLCMDETVPQLPMSSRVVLIACLLQYLVTMRTNAHQALISDKSNASYM
jgi:hypothetical protein